MRGYQRVKGPCPCKVHNCLAVFLVANGDGETISLAAAGAHEGLILNQDDAGNSSRLLMVHATSASGLNAADTSVRKVAKYSAVAPSGSRSISRWTKASSSVGFIARDSAVFDGVDDVENFLALVHGLKAR